MDLPHPTIPLGQAAHLIALRGHLEHQAHQAQDHPHVDLFLRLPQPYLGPPLRLVLVALTIT